MIFVKLALNLALLFFSLINVYKCKIFNIKKANYFILKNTENLIDPRSIRFSNINEVNLSNSINFVRSVSFKLSFKALINLKNIIIINCFYDSLYLVKKIFKRNLNKIEEEFSSKISSIIQFSKVREFRMIDDYRLMKLFLPILNKLKISSIGYMHGRISSDLDFQKNLKTFKFKKYYVWNKYFKRKILGINKKYKPDEIVIKNHLKKYKQN